MKKLLCMLFILLLAFSAVAEGTAVSALVGPTGMGMVKLMKDDEGVNAYEFTLAASADMITPALIKGETDVACVPANLASVLFNKTGGAVRVVRVNTLGVLYLVERGETVSSIADLKGRTLYSGGKGASPEYVLNFLLRENGLDPEKDLNVEYKSEHAECLSALMNDETAVALLPQPFVTVAQGKMENLRIAVDLNTEWAAVCGDAPLVTGVVVARADFIENEPEALDAFLKGYDASVEYVNANPEDAAALIDAYGIVARAVAEKALPYCNIVSVCGEEMKEMLSGYLQVLFEQDAASVGGQLPDESFYYEG